MGSQLSHEQRWQDYPTIWYSQCYRAFRKNFRVRKQSVLEPMHPLLPEAQAEVGSSLP